MYYQEPGPLFLTQNGSPLFIQESRDGVLLWYVAQMLLNIYIDEELMLDALFGRMV